MTSYRLCLVALALLAIPGCSKRAARQSAPAPREPAQPTEMTSGSARAQVIQTLPPLSGHPWLVRLSESTGHDDVVTLPLGATEQRPVIVAVHGAGDRADWACGGWRLGVESYAFVVCPSGRPMGQSRYGWGSVGDIDAAIERALGETKRRFPQYLAPEPMIYAAFSQGAIMARPYLVANARRFPIIALAEGGYDYLRDPEFARQYYAAGGRRVLLLCGTAQCRTSMSRAQSVLARAHLEVLVGGDLTSGHNLNAPMQFALRRIFPEFVAEVPEWKGFATDRSTNGTARAL